MANAEAEGNRPGTAASTEALLRRSETLARVLSTAELVADAEAVSAAAVSCASAEADAEAAAAEAEAVAAAEAAAKAEAEAAAAVEPRTPSSDAADAAGAAEVEEDVEADLIKGTLQYTEAQARLRGWLEAAGVEGSCLEQLQRCLDDEGEIYSLGRFRRWFRGNSIGGVDAKGLRLETGLDRLVAARRISIGTLHLVEDTLEAEEAAAKPAEEAEPPPLNRRLSRAALEAAAAEAAAAEAAAEAARA